MINSNKSKIILSVVFISLISIGIVFAILIEKNNKSIPEFEDRFIQSLKNFKNTSYESDVSILLSTAQTGTEQPADISDTSLVQEVAVSINGVTNGTYGFFGDSKASFEIQIQGYEFALDTLQIEDSVYVLINKLPVAFLNTFIPNIDFALGKWIEVNKKEIVKVLKKYNLSAAEAEIDEILANTSLSSPYIKPEEFDKFLNLLKASNLFYKIESSKIGGETTYDVKLNPISVKMVLNSIVAQTLDTQEEKNFYKTSLEAGLKNNFSEEDYSLLIVIDDKNILKSLFVEYEGKNEKGIPYSIVLETSINILSEAVEIETPKISVSLVSIIESIIKDSLIESFVTFPSVEQSVVE